MEIIFLGNRAKLVLNPKHSFEKDKSTKLWTRCEWVHKDALFPVEILFFHVWRDQASNLLY